MILRYEWKKKLGRIVGIKSLTFYSSGKKNVTFLKKVVTSFGGGHTPSLKQIQGKRGRFDFGNATRPITFQSEARLKMVQKFFSEALVLEEIPEDSDGHYPLGGIKFKKRWK
tara:strand:+ start:246 stop:581 length:336 start_codon:yes stop_codon:yes gene_type:complete